MELRPTLAHLVERLHAETPPGDAVSLNALGEALGTLAVSAIEIEAMMLELEARGRRVGDAREDAPGDALDASDAPAARRHDPSPGETRLRVVVQAARELSLELGRPATRGEIVQRTGLGMRELDHALDLARIIQRG